MDEIIWEPTAETIASARITAFMARCGVTGLEELQEKALGDPGWFWRLVTEDLGVAWYEPPTQTLDTTAGVPWAKWFRGGRMNIARDCADKHVEAGRGDRVAVIHEGEEGEVRTWTYGDLLAESNRLANGLRALGVGAGDRVGIFLPMIPETVAALIAVAKLGAVFVPIFSGFSAQAAGNRLADAEVRLLITVDGFYRRGKHVELKSTADDAVAAAPTVIRTVVVRRCGIAVPWQAGRDVWYHELVQAQSAQFETSRMDPEDPLMILYTSGTTGRPKGAVHVHGGFPIKAAQDMSHCFDLGERDVMLWLTDIGWMMGPWLIFGTLMQGAATVLYDGAPDYPRPDRLWEIVARHRITHLGLSPTVIRALAPYGDDWPARHDLSSLRIIGGTGEPWNPEPYRWFFTHVGGGRCPLINYSGGTEISGGIFGCVPTRPLKVCSFNVAIPGMGVRILDESGKPAPAGTVGELALITPWPGMTRGFWRDTDRYLETYWSRFPGVWVHGDWASVDGDGFWYIHGRSDDTIKIAGKRVGPAEYESILVSHPEVTEAGAIGVPHEIKGETVVCFVTLRKGTTPSAALAAELKELVARGLGKPMIPSEVKFVGALPKTRNGKIMRRVIRAAYLGQEPGELSALENPEAIQAIREVK